MLPRRRGPSLVGGRLQTQERQDADSNANKKSATGSRGRRKDPKALLQQTEEAHRCAKRKAAAKQRLLVLRTGTLHDFINLSAKKRGEALATSHKSGVVRGAGKRPRNSNFEERSTAEMAPGTSCRVSDVLASGGDVSTRGMSGGGSGISRNTRPGEPAVKLKREGSPQGPTRLQQTLHRYRFFADPVNSEREALRSLELRNSLYPTLRFAQPWEESGVNPLDEYMSSSSSSSDDCDDELCTKIQIQVGCRDLQSTSGVDLRQSGSRQGGRGLECTTRAVPKHHDSVVSEHDSRGGEAKLRATSNLGLMHNTSIGLRHSSNDPRVRLKHTGSVILTSGMDSETNIRFPDGKMNVNDPTRAGSCIDVDALVTPLESEHEWVLKARRRECRRRRQNLTRARREFNAELAADAGWAAAEEEEAAAKAARDALIGRKPHQVDVSRLPHFRYSAVKGTLSLGSSEESWISDGMYEGSSVEAFEEEFGDILPREFYGSGARPRFYDLFRLAHRQRLTVDGDGLLEKDEFTPRRRFLRDTVERETLPLPAVMRNKRMPFALDLAFRGLGDKAGLSLATALPDLPLLNELNLRDNRLTDASLANIVAAAIRMESLTSLDLSCNKIDDSAMGLRAYVASSKCTLQRLSLSKADVDDNECYAFMEALATNFSVKALDLSHNMIGEKETYNFVRPDYTTGGEAIAEMLETNITLTSLDLSWNSVRMESGIALGKSLAHNEALTELRLPHNSLADAGIQAIAQSLRSNTTLKVLDVSFNKMKPRSAMVMANALLDNSTLEHLAMNHNNVGRVGARALFTALRQRTRPGVHLTLDMQSCEWGAEAQGELFDMYDPSGRYELDLSKPYDYMVARVLLDIANKREGCEIIDVEHATGEKGPWKAVALLRSSPSSPAGDKDETSPGGVTFGERALSGRSALVGSVNTLPKAVAGAGDWQTPAEALLRRRLGAGSTEQSLKDEMEAFFRELGFDALPDVVARICRAFTQAREVERRERDRVAEAKPAVRSSRDSKTSNVPSEVNAGTGSRKTRPSANMRGVTAFAAAVVTETSITEPTGSRDTTETPAVVGPTTPFDMAEHLFELLFCAADTDNSGCIDHAEFREILFQLGREITPEIARHCLARYDIDRSNTVETGEFVDFMRHEFLVQMPAPPGCWCESSGGGNAWEIPREGKLRISVVADHVPPAPVEVASEEVVEAVITNIRLSAKTEQDRLEMFNLATEGTDFYMTSLNAQAVVNEWHNGINLVDILEVLLPQMSSSRNVVSLLENNLNYQQKLELRNKLGKAWPPLVGNPTGCYCLDMTDKRHRVAARRLAMINHAERAHGCSGNAGRTDTTQRGHWNNFRNETFNGNAFPGRGLEGRWFVNMPLKGKLRFDYAATSRPHSGTRPLSNRRFRQLLDHLDLGDMERSTDHPVLYEPRSSTTITSNAASAAVAAFVDIAAKLESPNMKRRNAKFCRAESGLLQAPLKIRSSAGTTVGTPHFNVAVGGSLRGTSDTAVSVGGWSVSSGMTQSTSESVHIARVHAMIKAGELRPIPPDQIFTFHADYRVTSKAERRRAWAIAELGRPLVPDDDDESDGDEHDGHAHPTAEPNVQQSRSVDHRDVDGRARGSVLASRVEVVESSRVGGGGNRPQRRSVAREATIEGHTTENKRVTEGTFDAECGDGSGRSDGVASVDEKTGMEEGHDERGRGNQEVCPDEEDQDTNTVGTATTKTTGTQAGAAAAVDALRKGGQQGTAKHRNGGNTNVAVFDSKPNFGEKQKPLYHQALLWRKRIGKPKFVRDYKLALNKLCELQVQMLHHWLTVDQVIAIVCLFPRFDMLRVIVATALFDRLVDIDNLDRLLDEFMPTEAEEFLWRIGPLNCYNPMKPDRVYDLDLTHRDDRETCKILARLAVEEPGENWVDEQYSWSYGQRPVPGWELPLPWTTPDTAPNGGPRRFGRLILTYSSDPANGCSPKWKLREHLMEHVLAGTRTT